MVNVGLVFKDKGEGRTACVNMGGSLKGVGYINPILRRNPRDHVQPSPPPYTSLTDAALHPRQSHNCWVGKTTGPPLVSLFPFVHFHEGSHPPPPSRNRTTATITDALMTPLLLLFHHRRFQEVVVVWSWTATLFFIPCCRRVTPR